MNKVIENNCSNCFPADSSKIHHSEIEKSIIEGEIHFFFSVDMREFLVRSNGEKIKKSDIDEIFEKFQGSRDFANKLRQLRLSQAADNAARNHGANKTTFKKILFGWLLGSDSGDGFYDDRYRNDRSTDELRTNGFNNGIFGAVLSDNWLNFPTFRSEDEDGIWLIRCSWLGIFEIHLIKIIKEKQRMNFVDFLEEILKNRTRLNDRDSIWDKVFNKIKEFCKQADRFEYENIKFVNSDAVSEKAENHISLEQRQRYVMILAKNIICRKCGNRLPAEVLGQNSLLSAMLYSSLMSSVGKTEQKSAGKNEIKIPDLNSGKVVNLSTWENEICAFGSERGFIYYDPYITIEEKNEFSYDYDEYWKYILRGVQHTVTVRAVLQSLQTQIKKLTDKLPELIIRIDEEEGTIDKLKSYSEKRNAVIKTGSSEDNLARSLSNILQIMPQINNICIPTVAFKANYAVDKFEYLNECFGFRDLLHSLRRDIRDVSAILQFSKSHQLQIEVEKRRATDRIRNDIAKEQLERDKDQDRKREDFGSWIAVAAIIFVAPTAVNDLAIIFSKALEDESKSNFYLWFSLPIYVCIAYILWRYKRHQEKKRESQLNLDGTNSDKDEVL